MSEALQRLREDVADFAAAEVALCVPELEVSRTTAHALSRHIARQGWIGAAIPAAYGGMGAGHLAKTLVIEELSRVSAAMGAMLQASQLGAAPIVLFGSEEQKKTWLPAITSGEVLPTIAVTEPGSGGHVLGMTSSAVRDGDEWVLNGSKVHVGNSHLADLHVVVARTGEGSKGLTAFLVESDRPGFSLAGQRSTMGLHGFSFGELRFTGCRIPAANMLGAEGDGRDVAYAASTLCGRANLAAVALGNHQAILEETAAFCADRQRYGSPLADLGTIKLKLGQMTSRLMTARLAAYHAAHLLDAGESCDAELMNAKLINTEYALDSARNAMEIHAAAGLFTDRPIERYLRDAHHLFAPAGTSDIQRLRLGEHALGTAKGSWSARFADLVRTDAATVNDARTPQELPNADVKPPQ